MHLSNRRMPKPHTCACNRQVSVWLNDGLPIASEWYTIRIWLFHFLLGASTWKGTYFELTLFVECRNIERRHSITSGGLCSKFIY